MTDSCLRGGGAARKEAGKGSWWVAKGVLQEAIYQRQMLLKQATMRAVCLSAARQSRLECNGRTAPTMSSSRPVRPSRRATRVLVAVPFRVAGAAMLW